jgi:hypothetical protein
MIKRGKGKKAIMQIPFGMLFSVILIIAFIALAIYIIVMFLNMEKCVETGMFKQDFQEAVNRAWSSEKTSEIFKGSLPGSIQQVCFVDASKQEKGKYKEHYSEFQLYESENKNMFFWPLESSCEGQRSFVIEHVDIEKITGQENPYCIQVEGGRIELKIEKDFYDALVYVK